MVWRSDGPQGNESAKVMFDVVPYMRGKVLDLGCGPRKIFPTVIGVDNNKDRRLFGVEARPDVFADCETLDLFANGSVDTVFSSHLIEHIADYESALREWWRVIKPGGHLVLYCPHADWYPNVGMPGANPDHKHDFRNDDLTAAMRRVAWRTGKGWDQLEDAVRTGGHEYSILQVYRKRGDARTNDHLPLPKPEKTLGLVRLGAYGDALWITAVLPALKREGWHITLYTQQQGETSLKADPNLDRIIVQPEGLFGPPASGETAQLQTAYWLHEEKKYTRFVNLVGCVERHILPHPMDPNFWLPADQRRRLMSGNYAEAVAKWAGVAYDAATMRVRFTPTGEELAWAAQERAAIDGPLVMINPSGSSIPKWWPHTQAAMDLLDAAGVHCIVVGDLRGVEFAPPSRARVVGTEWDLRRVYTLAALCDVVIGVESAVINSVAHEKPLKIALLSHSTPENLTRDWDRTIALVPEGLSCYPCHRIHADWQFCSRVMENNSAACQNAQTADVVVGYALQWIRGEMKEAA